MLGDLPGILNRLFALPLTENPLNIRCAISDLVADLDGGSYPCRGEYRLCEKALEDVDRLDELSGREWTRSGKSAMYR